jgi:hypothetical protein
MSSAESALWIPLLAQLGVACVIAVILYRRVKRHVITEATGKTVYSWLCLISGVFVGPGVFFLLLSAFQPSLGHGEILFAALFGDLLMTACTLILGRICVGWVPIKW